MTRNDAREIMMKILYEMEASDEMSEESAARLAREHLAGNHVERGEALLTSIACDLGSIDDTINNYSTRWKTSRMPRVDLAIMRLAIGEMRYADDIPDAVAINEAINLAKKYSTADSFKFIHGVLGAIAKNSAKTRGEDEQ